MTAVAGQRVLIAGCGSIGARRARLLLERAELSARWSQLVLYDRRMRAASDLCDSLIRPYEPGCRPNVEWTTDWNQSLLAADTVLVCAPLPAHVDLALDALNNGKSVFIEKPFARRPDLVGNFPGLAAERGSRAMVACNWRFHPVIQQLAAEPAERSLAIGFGIYPRLGEKDGGGWLLDLGSHALDLLQHLRGPIAGVQAYVAMAGGGASLTLLHQSGQLSRTALWYADPSFESETRLVQVFGEEHPRLLPPTDDMYADEMAHFLSDEPVCNDLAAALRTLNLLEDLRFRVAE